MPKPSVALCSAKPTISVPASAVSPARAETPMARPSEKLWMPIAVAMSMPSVSAAWRACSATAPLSNPASSGTATLPPDSGGSGRRDITARSSTAIAKMPSAKPPSISVA